MPLSPIPSQPILFKPSGYSPDNPRNDVEAEFCPPCAGDSEYCLKYAEGDFASFQMLNEPDLMDFSGNDCNFYEVVYEMAQEDFDQGEGWTYVDPAFVFEPGGGLGALALISGFTPVSGAWYLLTVTVSINNSGVLQIYWGATLIRSIGGAPGQYISTIIVQAPNGTDMPSFIPTANTFDGQVDDFTISSIVAGWEIDNWIPQEDDCGFCIGDHELSSTLILPDSLISGTGNAYYISFEIRDRTQGAILLEGADNPISSDESLYAAENGFYGMYFFVSAGNTRLKFTALDNFDRCIYNIKLYVQCRNYRVLLVSADQQSVHADLTSHLLYNFNWMTLPPVQLSDEYAMVIGDCYRLIVIRDCYDDSDNLIQDLTTFPWGMDDNATTLGDGSIEMDGTGDPSQISYVFSGDELDIDCTRCFILDIEILEHDGETGSLTVNIAGVVIYNMDVTSSGLIRIYFDWQDLGIPCPIEAGDYIRIYYRDSIIVISDISLYYDNACPGQNPTPDFYSNCIQYLGEEWRNECLSIAIAGMDNQPVDVPTSEVQIPLREAFGFLWGVGFRPSFREHFVFHNPHHVGASNTYSYNNGTNKRTSAETEKRWDVSVSHIDDNLHDTIALMLKLDFILFSKLYQFTPYNQQLYIGVEDDYRGNWPTEAKMTTADGKFEVARKRHSRRYSNNII